MARVYNVCVFPRSPKKKEGAIIPKRVTLKKTTFTEYKYYEDNDRVQIGRIRYGTCYPEPGKTTAYDDSQSIDLDGVLNGGFLVKILVMSIDPYMRSRMRDPSIKSYVPAYRIGSPLENVGVGVVLRSEAEEVKTGDHLYGMYPFREYVLYSDISELYLARVLENKEGLPWSVYTGVCGLAGQTAYFAWKEFARAKPDDVVFVTSAGGPVGATVVQLAKQAQCKVIASAGSHEKVAFLQSLGADVTIDYKTENTTEVLLREGPINIYWDNVGGRSLDGALEAAAWYARFIECGMISTYNSADTYVMKNLPQVVYRSLSLHGFTIMDLYEKYRERFYTEMPQMVKEGRIKYTEDISIGLENVGEAILEVQQGRNRGKKVIVVAEE